MESGQDNLARLVAELRRAVIATELRRGPAANRSEARRQPRRRAA